MYCIDLKLFLYLHCRNETTILIIKDMAGTENIKSQMRKGFLEYCILLLLERKGVAYTSDIMQGLKDAHLIVVEGTLYPLLTRLKNSQMLEYEWQESTQGPPRKYYKLTEEGRANLAELQEAWVEIRTTIDSLANITSTDNNNN